MGLALRLFRTKMDLMPAENPFGAPLIQKPCLRVKNGFGAVASIQ